MSNNLPPPKNASTPKSGADKKNKKQRDSANSSLTRLLITPEVERKNSDGLTTIVLANRKNLTTHRHPGATPNNTTEIIAAEDSTAAVPNGPSLSTEKTSSLQGNSQPQPHFVDNMTPTQGGDDPAVAVVNKSVKSAMKKGRFVTEIVATEGDDALRTKSTPMLSVKSGSVEPDEVVECLQRRRTEGKFQIFEEQKKIRAGSEPEEMGEDSPSFSEDPGVRFSRENSETGALDVTVDNLDVSVFHTAPPNTPQTHPDDEPPDYGEEAPPFDHQNTVPAPMPHHIHLPVSASMPSFDKTGQKIRFMKVCLDAKFVRGRWGCFDFKDIMEGTQRMEPLSTAPREEMIDLREKKGRQSGSSSNASSVHAVGEQAVDGLLLNQATHNAHAQAQQQLHAQAADSLHPTQPSAEDSNSTPQASPVAHSTTAPGVLVSEPMSVKPEASKATPSGAPTSRFQVNTVGAQQPITVEAGQSGQILSDTSTPIASQPSSVLTSGPITIATGQPVPETAPTIVLPDVKRSQAVPAVTPSSSPVVEDMDSLVSRTGTVGGIGANQPAKPPIIVSPSSGATHAQFVIGPQVVVTSSAGAHSPVAAAPQSGQSAGATPAAQQSSAQQELPPIQHPAVGSQWSLASLLPGGTSLANQQAALHASLSANQLPAQSKPLTIIPDSLLAMTGGGHVTTQSVFSEVAMSRASSMPHSHGQSLLMELLPGTKAPAGSPQLNASIIQAATGGIVGLEGPSTGGTNVVALDNKIEQAMDLVKTHLMYAVREEVEVLRTKIGELETKVLCLERENAILREHVPPETLAALSIPPPSSNPPVLAAPGAIAQAQVQVTQQTPIILTTSATQVSTQQPAQGGPH